MESPFTIISKEKVETRFIAPITFRAASPSPFEIVIEPFASGSFVRSTRSQPEAFASTLSSWAPRPAPPVKPVPPAARAASAFTTASSDPATRRRSLTKATAPSPLCSGCSLSFRRK